MPSGNNAAEVTKRLKRQFALRSSEFDISANWITDKKLMRAHTDLAGSPKGRALDLCCGTGQVGRALEQKGWDVRGLDICRNMARAASFYFPALEGMAEKIPFKPGSFRLVVCRQTFQFLDIKKTLAEIAKILAPEGVFILSLTVPFSAADKDWLYKVHRAKQPLLVKFYTENDLVNNLEECGFIIKERRVIVVRESINRWMSYAPELPIGIRQKVIDMIKNAPGEYKKLHRVKVVNEEVFENWNWAVLKTSFIKNQAVL